ncbi:eukaryotic translation initiation factor 4G1-domain-containing protein [Lactarius hengduanensis]|nr:eukaryotic translation initiation factor 4G1-domain-containing protein [Lactarius hengduanensis]
MSGTASSSSVSSIPQSTSTSTTPRALPSALATARHIEDLNRITYPEGIKSPKVELNVNAQDGKFRYDRDFLLQFMNVCKEKPDNLPPLDALGLEPRDVSLSKPRGGSSRNRASNNMPIPGNVRSGSIGLSFPMGNSAGSVFQVGQFSTSAREISGEGRFLVAGAGSSASVSGGALGGRPPAMVRTIGQSGTKSRDRTRSKRGASARVPNRADHPIEPVAPLEVSTDSWDGSGLDSESPPIRSM